VTSLWSASGGRRCRRDLDSLILDPAAWTLVALVDDEATVAEILVAAKTDLVEGTLLLERLAEDGIVAFV
jgi:hypothetical protein